MSTRLRRPALNVSALVLVCAIGVVAASLASASRPTMHHRLNYHAASARLQRAFSVLDRRSVAARSAASTTAPLPEAVANVMPKRVPGAEPAGAAYAGGTYPAWVVPAGSSKVCLVAGSTGPTSVPSSTCAELAWAEQHGLAIVTENSTGTSVVFGLVPNRNTSVAVTETDGSTRNVEVANNVYEIVGGSPKSVKANGLDGASWERTVGPMSPAPTESKPHTPSP